MQSGKSILFVGVAGRATGGVAMDLAARGWEIFGTGSAFFPPMGPRIETSQVKVLSLEEAAIRVPDFGVVVAGALELRGNPVIEAALEHRVPLRSLPTFLRENFLQKSRNLVVAGTNGKTTTTAMLAWILECMGKSPDYLIGGDCRNFSSTARWAGAEVAVLEGDEFASGLGDRNPKFLHYLPHALAITNCSFDHPEVFRDERDYRQAFAYLLQWLPRCGRLVLTDHSDLDFLAARAPCELVRIGFGDSASHRLIDLSESSKGISFQLGGAKFSFPLWGKFNAINAAQAASLAETEGISLKDSANALEEFRGVLCRQEIVFADEFVTVISDDAYHPEAVRELISSLRSRFPHRAFSLVLQPRYTGGSDAYQQAVLADALLGVDQLWWLPPKNFRTFSDLPFDCDRFADDLANNGIKQQCFPNETDLISAIPAVTEPTLVLICLGIGREMVVKQLCDRLSAS